jgi:excisionase family DNA binding protein
MVAAKQTIKLLLTAKEAADSLGIGVTKLYELLNQELIISVKVGRRRLISVSALEAFVEGLEQEQHGNSTRQ